MPIKAYYNAALPDFVNDDSDRILGILTQEHHHALDLVHSAEPHHARRGLLPVRDDRGPGDEHRHRDPLERRCMQCIRGEKPDVDRVELVEAVIEELPERRALVRASPRWLSTGLCLLNLGFREGVSGICPCLICLH